MIVLLTDFGLRDGYVGVMKGVIEGIAKGETVVDLSHDIPPQDVRSAAFMLWRHYRFFPEGTIFCCVVDPGVGTGRSILALEADGYFFIAPDNGLLDYVMAHAKLKLMMKVESPTVMLEKQSSSFHGRDIFAPTAAHLAAGFLFTQLGPIADFTLPVSPFLIPEKRGQYSLKHLYTDHYGNLITNLWLERMDSSLAVTKLVIGDQEIERLSTTYSDVKKGALLATKASHGLLEIAQREGSAENYIDSADMEKIIVDIA
jgi:S-adenosylmethionine hydrolase